MKIAFYFSDKGFRDLDLSHPLDGNNGVGGTQYCFLTVGCMLAQENKHEVTYYHYNPNKLPDGIASKIVNDTNDLLRKAEQDHQDILIYKADGNLEFIQQIRETSLKVVAWAHNYIFSSELQALEATKQIVRVVFVGKEQYDRYIDHGIIRKSTFIYNMFDGKRFAFRKLPDTPAVTYTGSLVKPKGFHILARVWKDILKEVPNAQLYVIGSGQLYDRSSVLGSLGVADKKYEEVFYPYLTEGNQLLPSVHFCGNMGTEKLDIYRKTTVGVMNPSGRTETFGLSAVEMEACGIPVVTRAINGLFDTVADGETGYLVNSDKELAERIIGLLQNRTLNVSMGKRAKQLVEDAFAPERIITCWNALFEEIDSEEPASYLPVTGHYTNNMKWLRMVIRWMRKHHIPAMPLVDVECEVKRLLNR